MLALPIFPGRLQPSIVGRSGQAWAAKKDGVLVGYLSAEEDGSHLEEIVMAQESMILPAIKAWMSEKDVRLLHVAVAPHDTALNSLLAPICEDCSMTPNCMIRVLKPETVLPAYMKLKRSCDPLEKGALVLEWELMKKM